MVLEDTLKPSATFYATQKSRKYQIVDICVKLKLEFYNLATYPSEVFWVLNTLISFHFR